MSRRTFGTTRRLPSGRWQARYRTRDGRRVSAPTTFATKGDALRWLASIETDLARGDWHDPQLGEVPFEDVSKQWLNIRAPTLRASTVDLYRYLLRVHVSPTFGAVDIGKITPQAVQAWLGGLHANEQLSANTVAKAYRVLKGVCDFAVESRLIPRSPCTFKGAGTEHHKEMQIATPDQIFELVAAIGPRWEAFVFTAAYSGLRWGELCGLARRDVDVEAETITVRRQLLEVNGALSFGPPKTAAGKRTVALPTFVMRSLVVHMDMYSEPGLDGLVFPALEGGPLRRSNFRRRVWLPAIEAAGVPSLRFHDLRHTGATLAAASGASLRALMHRIGHSSAAAAIRYQHLLDG
jgi:integrase